MKTPEEQLLEVRRLLDDAGIEHSGYTQAERVALLVAERDVVRKHIIRLKVAERERAKDQVGRDRGSC